MILEIIVSSLIVLFDRTYGDYTCICNYNVEKSVFPTLSSQDSPIGYMYEFDCKEKLNMIQDQSGWYKVAFEHQIGYILLDDKIEEQLCPGDPSGDDVVSTTSSIVPSSSSSSSAATTTVPSSPPVISTNTQTQSSLTSRKQTLMMRSTTPMLTTEQTSTAGSVTMTSTTTVQNTFTLGNANLCSDTVRSFTQTNHGVLAQFDDNCYVLVKHIQHWSQAEQNCNSAGGHLVDISSRMEQEYLYTFLKTYYDHSIWIGLSDIQNEAHFKWSSGEQFYFVNWANHTHFSDSFEDCVVMDMHLHNGRWDDRECTFETYPYICQFGLAGTGGEISTHSPSLNTSSNFTDGNIQLCPSYIKSGAAFHGAILGQFERGCYELLLNTNLSWEHAENICQMKGGHLAHISNGEQQAFIESFMQRHNPNHAVWLGLHDTLTEGTFQWTAGTPVQYTNWIPGRVNSGHTAHNYEDCVALVPQQQGYWDDVPCGFEEIFGQDTGESHYAFCQYKIHVGINIIG